ncbi:hypothetical protein M2480_001841 [Parabacteroides sp. PFB2-12]|nr:hypothetical protein [Parabacteroides sp. PM6-13]MDH6390854.1 hypothetical protein [Parabacteroides sp. PFB2-12]
MRFKLSLFVEKEVCGYVAEKHMQLSPTKTDNKNERYKV